MKVKDLKGMWTAVRTTNEPSNEEKLEAWLKKLASFGIHEKDLIEEKDRWIHKRSGSYIMKTSAPKRGEGILVFKSKTYSFKIVGELQIHGDMPKASEMTDKGFYVVDYRGNRIEYTLITKI